MTKEVIRIANASGYWGDDPAALRRLVQSGVDLDYITSDFLAELSMSILEKQRMLDPKAGFARDFVVQTAPLLAEMKRRGIVLITNAGGINPRACAEALTASAKGKVPGLRIAIVQGDSLMSRLSELAPHLSHLDDGTPFSTIASSVKAANVYIGGAPIAQALSSAPDVVICGRVSDSGLTVGPLMHEFGWGQDDPRIASAVIAGHLIECSTQVCGGNFTDWPKVKSFDEIGAPIVEVRRDGSFELTKTPCSGGMISTQTVREQLLYEISDPAAYLTPDASANISSLELKKVGEDRVSIKNVSAGNRPSRLKVSIAYEDGHKVSGAILVSGPDARKKAEIFSKVLWENVSRELGREGLSPCASTLTEFIGDDAFHRELSDSGIAKEIYLRFVARDQNKRKLEIVRKMVPSLILAGPPGVAAVGGAPAISDVVGFWPALIPLEFVRPSIEVFELNGSGLTSVHNSECHLKQAPCPVDRNNSVAQPKMQTFKSASKIISVPLVRIGHARSGDKGDTANIALIGRSAVCFEWLRDNIDVKFVQNTFKSFEPDSVVRFEAANLWGLNFVLSSCLDGGGTKSLRLDSQGKTLGQALLRVMVDIPEELLSSIADEDAYLES